MPIEIKCPQCGQDGKVRSDALGKTIACGRCRFKFVVREIPADLEVTGSPSEPVGHENGYELTDFDEPSARRPKPPAWTFPAETARE